MEPVGDQGIFGTADLLSVAKNRGTTVHSITNQFQITFKSVIFKLQLINPFIEFKFTQVFGVQFYIRIKCANAFDTHTLFYDIKKCVISFWRCSLKNILFRFPQLFDHVYAIVVVLQIGEDLR